MDINELAAILENHKKWLSGNGGVRANLRYADLRYANLRYADLRGADLCGADLSGADMCEANLRGADLCGANLSGADMCEANLRDADLCGANLRGADLCEANLRDANMCEANLRYAELRGAYMRGANMRYADLRGADLRGAKTTKWKISYWSIGVHDAPEGDLVVWGKKNGILVKMLVPAKAKRSCATTRKHRAEYVKVLEVIGANEAVVENEYGTTIYRPGEIVMCHEWDDDRWNECSGGIHFFLTREEAENW